MKKKAKLKKPKSKKWSKYGIEFLSVFIAVISAFMLSNWSEDRKDSITEDKILIEIYNGLEKDMEDLNENAGGHLNGVKAVDYFQKMLNGNEVCIDSLSHFFMALTRSFISIQNTSGYETLKSRGLELVEDDSLRYSIISLYEYYYSTLEKMEEEYSELQFQENYFHEINAILSPYFIFNENLTIEGIQLPLKLSGKEKNLVFSYLWKIKVNRLFMYDYTLRVKDEVKKLRKELTDKFNTVSRS